MKNDVDYMLVSKGVAIAKLDAPYTIPVSVCQSNIGLAALSIGITDSNAVPFSFASRGTIADRACQTRIIGTAYNYAKGDAIDM